MAEDNDNKVLASPLRRLHLLLAETGKRVAIVTAFVAVALLVQGLLVKLLPDRPVIEMTTMLKYDYDRTRMALRDLSNTFDTVAPDLYKNASPAVRAQLDTIREKIDIAESPFNMREQLGGRLELVGTAHAQSAGPSLKPEEFNRPLILYSLLGVLGVLLAGFTLIYAFTKDAERMKFAQSIIQTIVSFAIGVVAGMLGTSPGAA